MICQAYFLSFFIFHFDKNLRKNKQKLTEKLSNIWFLILREGNVVLLSISSKKDDVLSLGTIILYYIYKKNAIGKRYKHTINFFTFFVENAERPGQKLQPCNIFVIKKLLTFAKVYAII